MNLKRHPFRFRPIVMTAHSSKWRCLVGRGAPVGVVLAVLTLLCMPPGPLTKLWAKEAEPPVRVSISDLAHEPQRYDKQRVLVSGVVRAIEFQRGRRGSEYLLLTLEEIHAAPEGRAPSVSVVTADIPRVGVGDQIVVQGVYYVEGKEAGRFYERFIDAEEIRRERAA
jgi:hypothetical protein